MDAEKFKAMFFIDISLMFSIILKLTPEYFNAAHGSVSMVDVKSALIDFDLSENMLLLAACFALCGYMMALDDSGQRNARTESAYYSAWCLLTLSAVVAKVGGINVPFSTKLESPYCWFLAVVVAVVFLPVIIHSCQVIHQLLQTTTSTSVAHNGNPTPGMPASTRGDILSAINGAGPGNV